MSELPTWGDIAGDAHDALHKASVALSDARDWMKSDWREGQGPTDFKQKREAEKLIAEAKAAVTKAKNALAESAGQ